MTTCPKLEDTEIEASGIFSLAHFPIPLKGCLSGVKKVCAVMLLVYGDESLDGTQSRVCAVAGVIGPEEIWRELGERWLN